MLALTGVLLLAVFSGEIRDTDIWLHLKTGQHTLETRALTAPDPFSYTSSLRAATYPGEDITRYFNLTHEWLAQIFMYLLYSVAGFAGLVVGRALLLIAFCAIVGWIAFRRSGVFSTSLAAALSAACVAINFQQSRPFLATFVCLAATIAILESRRRLWLLPPIFLVWANCHGGFFMGWLVLGAYCAEALILRLRQRPIADERRLWMVAAASLLLSGLNPNGFRVLQVLLLYRSSGIQSTNLEWQRPMFWEPGMYSFLLFGSLAALLAARRRTRLVDWLLCLGFAAISLMAVRNTIFMAMVGPVVISAYAPRRRGIPAAAVLLAAVLLVYEAKPAMASGNVFAWRAAEWQLPSGAADFIQAHRMTDRMFNSYESGGYLVWRLWPMQRDFIDPRGLSEEAYADYRRILYDPDSSGVKGAEPLFRKYGIDMLVMEGFDFVSGQVYPLAVELADSAETEWKLVYADSKGFIFTRHPAAMQRLSSTALLESLEAQCEEHVRHDPSRQRCARGLGELYAFRHDSDRARRWMAYYLERRTGPDPEAERIYESLDVTSLNDRALSLEQKGDYAGAEPLFRRAVDIAERTLGPDHPDTAGSLNNLAGLLEAKGDYYGAEPLYRRALAIAERTLGPNDARTAMALENLAELLAAKGEVGVAEPLLARAFAIAEKTLGPQHETTQEIRESLQALRKHAK